MHFLMNSSCSPAYDVCMIIMFFGAYCCFFILPRLTLRESRKQDAEEKVGKRRYRDLEKTKREIQREQRKQEKKLFKKGGQ